VEKISNIVRGNSRVTSADLKSSSAVRPGVPTYGRPVGDSPPVQERAGTTASRAAALQTEMSEQRHASNQDRLVTTMADQFFMSRIRRPEEEEPEVTGPPRKEAPTVHADDDEQLHTVEAGDPQEVTAPVKKAYTPRGSYVNVHA
jgi:hypothetical protein